MPAAPQIDNYRRTDRSQIDWKQHESSYPNDLKDSVMLREFLYLDSPLVDNYLAQVEDGLYDAVKHRESGSHNAAAGGGLRTPVVNLEASGGGSSERESEHTLRQTPESRFNRLYGKLDARVIEDFSSNIWGSINRGEILDVTCELEVSSIARLLAQSDQISPVIDLMRTFNPSTASLDDQTINGLKTLSSMGGNDKFIATGELDTEGPVFAFRLDKSNLRCDLDDLDGEVNVLGKVERKWPQGESHSIMSIPGLSLMSRRDRREAMKRKDSTAEPVEGTELDGPGVSMSVIAIYR